MARNTAQGIVVEFVGTAQCIVVEMFEASLPCLIGKADLAQSLQAPSLRQQQQNVCEFFISIYFFL